MAQNLVFIKQEPNQPDPKHLYCRICLRNSITTDCKQVTAVFNSGQTLAQIIKEFAQIQILESDGYSQLICLGCIGKLTVALELKALIQESDTKLKRRFPKIVGSSISNEGKDAFKTEESDLTVLIKEEEEPNTLNENDERLSEAIYEIDDDEDEDDDMECVPSNLQQIGGNAVENLPQKSADIYKKQYTTFMSWCDKNNVEEYTEEIFLSYFAEKAKAYKSSTLWSTFSMLKSTISMKHNIDISKFHKLLAFIKEQNIGYKAKKSNIFSREEIKRFLIEAPDKDCLMWKVCLIFGVAGGCRMEDLKKMLIDDIEDKGNILIITIPDSKTRRRKSFIITNKNCEDINPINIYRKYITLRPSTTPHRALFIFYRSGKCSVQPVGIHTFGKIPSLIANYLKLPDANAYTGHAFRRTSASLLIDTGNTSALTLKQECG